MNYFVYVVCGAKQFIEELNFSLKYLKHFSKYPVLVLTDLSRNEAEIAHDRIVDIRTPAELKNHQAHLYLETRMTHYLPIEKEDICCYIDSDIIAISEKINQVFDYFHPPVTFAADHCTIDYFSPGVFKCGCADVFERRARDFFTMRDIYPIPEQSSEILAQQKELEAIFSEMKQQPVKNAGKVLAYLFRRYFSGTKDFTLGDFTFKAKNKCWYNSSGELIDFDIRYHNKKIWKLHRFTNENGIWKNQHGEILAPETPKCTHLREHLNKDYALNIPEKFQHWNGGVFLCNKDSQNFMDDWHNITFAEIGKGKIKPYDDQASLIVTACKHNHIKMQPLPPEYNYIADFGHPKIKYHPEKGFTNDNFTTTIRPAFLHVYHHWGDMDWELWKFIIDLGVTYKIITETDLPAYE